MATGDNSGAIKASSAGLDLASHKAINMTDPTGPQDGATKAYVDSVAAGLAVKPSVLVASTANVAALVGLAVTVDGTLLSSANTRVLLKDQSTATQNGPWLTQVGAWTRPTDFAAGSHAAGAFVFVESGTVNAGAGFVCATVGPSDVVNTNNLTFTQFSGAGEITVDTTLIKTVNQLAVNQATATPAALGTAAVGTGVKSAKEDHIHARGGYGQAAASGELATRLDRDRGVITVAGITGAALSPGYALTPGTLGVGDTLLASSNGAFPALAGGATVTVGAPNGGDLFLLHHGTSAADNRVWQLTAQGAGGSKYAAIAYDGCDTAAKIVGSKIRVMGGPLEPPQEYVYVGSPSPTVNTSLLYWLNMTPNGSLNEIIHHRSDFCQTLLPTTGTMLSGSEILGNFLNGAGTAFTVEADNGASVNGAISCSSGTTATGRAGWISSWIASATNPAEGFSVLWAQALGVHLEVAVAVPTLSTGAQEYEDVIGFINAISASAGSAQVSPNGVYMQYDRTNSVNWASNVESGGTPTRAAGSVAADSTYRHLIIHKDAGSNTARFVAGGAEIGSGVDCSALNGTLLGLCIALFKSVGTTSIKGLKIDFVDLWVSNPARRYA